ncbi:hypothetical protein WH47_00724 [Habropoda laboriosa]|uniref:Uncharacterized protein n=1 Tax=Habropoda laboriosa TaxID=597456 RepID=A0A0L7QYL9_9HYME|nr:hypothetical protein WH47_00724 [Habropoda laboriosa]
MSQNSKLPNRLSTSETSYTLHSSSFLHNLDTTHETKVSFTSPSTHLANLQQEKDEKGARWTEQKRQRICGSP